MTTRRRRLGIPLVVGVLVLVGCGAAAIREPSEPSAAWDDWRAARREELVGPEGWLSLVGLFWLEPGESTIGSDPASTFVLPRGPAYLGRVVVGDEVRFVGQDHDENLVLDAPLALGDLRVMLIERGGRRALRVRDVESPARQSFGEIPVYDYDASMRVRAHVRAPEPGRMLSLVNVLGMQVDEPCVAILDLTLGASAITLVASDDGEGGYFVMLRDATAGEGETYGAGRYLDVPAADANGETWVDFNRLYTPPCGYTSLATCPLPPEENVLSIPIRAGERYTAQPH